MTKGSQKLGKEERRLALNLALDMAGEHDAAFFANGRATAAKEAEDLALGILEGAPSLLARQGVKSQRNQKAIIDAAYGYFHVGREEWRVDQAYDSVTLAVLEIIKQEKKLKPPGRHTRA